MGASRKIDFVPKRDIPSLEGMVIVVTGGNTGLGKQTILELAKHNPAKVWLASRSVQRGDAAVTDIRTQVPRASIETVELDLESFDSVRAAARKILAESTRLDLLFLNAGVNYPRQEFTKDGYEKAFGMNHMGHALLFRLLLPLLLQTAETTHDARVVVLGSDAHKGPPRGGIQFEFLKKQNPGYVSQFAYGQSKLANILWAKEAAIRYPQLKIVAVHPGAVHTNTIQTMTEGKPIRRFLFNMLWAVVAVPVEDGAKNPLWAATAKEVVSGEYYGPVGVTGQGSALTKDRELREKLWQWTETELENYNCE
ncbi:short-chain dehydrogenase/reductase [Xylariales sp. PMI_506]|nr:short-chain dehydrogenase/reductase [Xylariales sp. PMI_506]